MLKKSSKGSKVSGKSGNDTEDNYGGVWLYHDVGDDNHDDDDYGDYHGDTANEWWW